MQSQSSVQTIDTLKANLESERQAQQLAYDIDMALANLMPDSVSYRQQVNFVHEVAAVMEEAGMSYQLVRGEVWSFERDKGVLENVAPHEWLEVPTRVGAIIIDPNFRCALMNPWTEDGVDFDMPTVLTIKQAQAIGRGYEGMGQDLSRVLMVSSTHEADHTLPDIRRIAHEYAHLLEKVSAA